MKNKKSWRKIIDVHLWAMKVWWKIDPQLFLSTSLCAIVRAVTPYVTVWLSAQLINELTGSRVPSALWKWIILTLCITGGLKLLSEILYRWKDSVHSMENWHEDKLMADKMMDMDFSAVESPHTNDLRYSMRKFQMGNVCGFTKLHNWYCEAIVGGVASVAGAVTLTVSLFSQKVPEGAWTVLNNGWVSVLVIMLLLGGTILSPWLSAKSVATYKKLWPYQNRYNRVLNTFATLHMSTTSCVDVRMYHQQELATQVMEGNQIYTKGSAACRICYREQAPLYTAATAVSVLLVGITYVFVCLKAWAGAFGIGSVTQYVGAVTNLCSGISELFQAVGNLPQNADYLYAIRDFMEIPNDMYQGSLPTEKRDFRLVSLPLGQNVAASIDYDRERAEDCLRKSGFGERLDSMPNGLDTYLYKDLEKSGVSISGGEAQKIAIARALYKDAPFIILDEPTAALDPVAEAEIYEKFDEIAGDKTAIYISHRLSSCKFCDEIAVFHEGTVIQQGTHETLVADTNGKYYELWNAQAQYYTE